MGLFKSEFEFKSNLMIISAWWYNSEAYNSEAPKTQTRQREQEQENYVPTDNRRNEQSLKTHTAHRYFAARFQPLLIGSKMNQTSGGASSTSASSLGRTTVKLKGCCAFISEK